MAGWEEGCLSLQEVTGGPSSYKCLMMMVKMMMVMVMFMMMEDDDGEDDGRLTLPHKR